MKWNIGKRKQRLVGSVFTIYATFSGLHAVPAGDLVSNGTFLAFSYGPDYVVVGADSRRHWSLRAIPDDDSCKIMPLAPQTVFTTEGFSGAYTEDGTLIFDPQLLAKSAFETVTSRYPETMAKEWGRETVDVLNVRERTGKGAELTGYFAGVDAVGSYVYFTHVLFFSQEKQWKYSTESLKRLGNGVQTRIIDDTFKEFVLNDSTRAREFRQARAAQRDRLNGADLKAFDVQSAVQFQITFDSQISADKTHKIGGQPAVLIIENGRGSRWYPMKPNFCPEAQ